MARQTFGAGVGDFAVTPSDGLWGVATGVEVTFWDSMADGNRYTDLQDESGDPIASVVTDEYGALPRFQGPDGVIGMWADAGGSRRAWMDAHGIAGGGGGGGGGKGGGYTSLARVVASATAPEDVRAAASYVCTGVADQTVIQAAINAAQSEGGGVVQLSVGTFNLTAPVTINGTANEDNPLTVTLVGCGEFATVLKPATNVDGILISNWAQCHLRDFGIVIQGSGSGIVSKSVTVPGADTRSFWDSSFRNLRINGSYTSTNSGWAMDLDMPFRSDFTNIEIEGTRKGIHLYNNSSIQNAGDCTFTRMFIEIVGAGGAAIHVESANGNMNQNNFSMVEAGAGAGATGTTGILIDGAAGGASQRFWGTNLEQFDTLINVAHGESNVFDLNYVTCRNGNAGNKAFVFGANSYNNRLSAMWVNVASNGQLKIIEDNNETDDLPNFFERIRIENNKSGNVTWSSADTSIFRDIVAFNEGTIQAGLLQLPQSNPVPMLATAAKTTTSTTLADVSGMGHWVHKGTYLVDIEGFVSTSAVGAYPVMALGGSAVWGAGSAVTIEVGTSPTAVAIARAAAVDSVSGNTSISAVSAPVLVRIRGAVVVSTAGMLRMRWRAAAAGTLTLQPGAYFNVRKID
ncbi:hypothetical protein ACIHCX_10635 [Streptomyces sp. NPDC052043]|uniref:hypothetical protein n=1 Tax=Streptomyces sp. NPDC052043 TaxID=3365684 RepID=UPI0037D58BEA